MNKIIFIILFALTTFFAFGQKSQMDSKQLEVTENQTVPLWNIYIPDANSRDTYFTMHNISEAHKYSKGKGIKVGILDWGFGFSKYRALYAGGECFNGNRQNFDGNNEHGLWMATVLKEIAPECEIYALGTFIPNDETKWVDAMEKGIEWAIENKIDILTLSHQQITDKNRERFDKIVNKAIAK